MFPVLFAIPRTAGWLAQWDEMLRDPDQKIARPRQIYIGRRAARLRPARQATIETPRRTCAVSASLVASGRRSSLVRLVRRCSGSRGPSPAPPPTRRRRRRISRRAATPSTAPRRSSTCGRWSRSARARPARRASARRAPTSPASSRASASPSRSSRSRRRRRMGPVEMVNLIVRLPGRRPDRILITGHYDTKLLRESALRRRERRRVERGVPDRARARAQRPAARVHLRARLVRRRRSRSSTGTSASRRPTTPTAAATTSQAAQKASASRRSRR